MVLLFHELAHTFHLGNGTFNAATPEPQAKTDENTYRTQVGLALRDVSNHNGGIGAGDGLQVPSRAAPGSPPGNCCCC